jgi:predicted ABC-type transport system involved in lysophospholipase L1 biosynthesis ATPase subunit
MLALREEQGTALVVVTHDLSLAARLDRCLRLESGQLKDEALTGLVAP